MKKILGVLKNRWTLILIGFVAICVLIWLVGPLLSIGGSAPLTTEVGRFLTMAIFGSSFALYQVFNYISTLQNNRRMLEGLLGGAAGAAGAAAGAAGGAPDAQAKARAEADAASAAEIDTLKKGLDDALKTLRKARLGGDRRGRRQQLYQLPWYIFIGPPGSGKTTALINSGLNFPLGKDKIKGVGGTRNCDWWFTDEAVMLDTAGRYTTQDSHQTVDQAAWRGFLDLLKKHRRRRPINGALVAVSLQDLLQQNEQERTLQAQAIKERIQELHEHLGIRFPIYVFFTKCDLVAGFVEFFNDLGREDRNQVWGMTFPIDDPTNPKGVVDHFAPEFDALDQRLNERLVERLYQEQDPQRRDLIYTLPHQFSSLKDLADQFLKQIFTPNVYDERSLLRGVYFTSGTQEGTPIDRLLSSLAATFNLGRQALSGFSGKGKSYFITNLFREVIFQEADLAGTNLKLERWRAWIQRGAYAGALLVTGLLFAAWLTSYARNQVYVNEVETQRQDIAAKAKALGYKQRDLVDTLPVLNAARNIRGGYTDRKASAPWLMGFGLYQGEKLGTEARVLYQYLLNRAFLPRFMLRLEQQLRQDPAEASYLQETLKVYLMLDASQRFDANIIKTWAVRDWEKDTQRPLTREQRDQLQGHLEALLEQGPVSPPFALDRNLINYTRARIGRVPVGQRLYEQIKRDYQSSNLPEFRLSDAAGPDTPRVFVRASNQPLNTGISGFYTYAGYHQVFAKESEQAVSRLSKDAWVLGREVALSPAEQQQLTTELCRRYFQDYFTSWRDFLADIKIKGFNSPAEAADRIQVLSGFDSPLGKLVRAVARETTLAPQEKKDDSKDKAQPAQPAPPETQPCNLDDFNQRFDAFRREVKGQEGAIPPLETTLATLNELYGQLHAVTRAGESGAQVPPDLKDQVVKVANRLEVEASRKPPPLNLMLQKLAGDIVDAIRTLKERLNTLWKTAQVAPFFQQQLNGRYPLSRASVERVGFGPATSTPVAPGTIQWAGQGQQQPSPTTFGPPDMNLDAFSRFFGPSGLMDDFFQKNLQPYVDTSQTPWLWRGSTDPAQGLTADALKAFQRAAVIRSALFSEGGQRPVLRFQLMPLPMDATISEALLSLDGQELNYNREQPARTVNLRWPGSGSGGARLQLSPQLPGVPSEISADGPWAWFRLLDRAQIRPTAQGTYQVIFQIGTRQALYEFRANNAIHPQLRELEGFSCPQEL